MEGASAERAMDGYSFGAREGRRKPAFLYGNRSGLVRGLVEVTT